MVSLGGRELKMLKVKRYTEPPFWDDFLDKEPLCLSLVKNYEVIKKEALRLGKICSFGIPGYGTFPNFKNVYVIDRHVRWLIAPFFGCRYDNHARRRASKLQLLVSDVGAFFTRLFCPHTYNLLKELFDDKIILNAYFTLASPDVYIRPHIHPQANGIHRMNIHLGLCCDPGAELTVGEETRTWEEGKLLAFKNTGPYRHSVFHAGHNDRVLLIVEVDVAYLEKYGVYKGVRVHEN